MDSSNFIVNYIFLWVNNLCKSLELSIVLSSIIKNVVMAIVIIVFAAFFYFIAKYTFRFILRIAMNCSFQLAQHLLESKFSASLVLLVPLWWIKSSVSVFQQPLFLFYSHKVCDLLLLFVIYRIINSILLALANYFNAIPQYKDKPIESYFQILM